MALPRHITLVYREARGFFACNAICYNHKSPRRGLSFVTRKITRGVAESAAGQRQSLPLGNLGIRRYWGYAPEYVSGMWRIYSQTAEDCILATGRTSSLQDALQHAFAVAGLD